MCGIDEAGRGPIAGPLVVAGVILKNNIKGLNDSKKISEKKREELFNTIIENSEYKIVFKSHEQIDTFGLSKCLKDSILEIMNSLDSNSYLMDGNTSFGIANLDHLVKADATIPEVSAASILAKVSRDRYMCEQALIYKNYAFEKHKGYGTKAHIEAIKKFNYCEIHRKSFKTKVLEEFFASKEQKGLF